MAEKESPAEWLQTTLREAPVRRGLVLFGNTRDLFFEESRKRYVTLPELLLRQLTSAERNVGFSIAAVWDNADGMRFASEQGERRFRELTRPPSPTMPQGGTEYGVNPEPAQRRNATGPFAGQPNELIIAFRQLLAAPSERPLLIVDWSHLLTTQPAHPDATERTWLTQIGKALVGDPVIPVNTDTLSAGAGGLLILVTANLGAVPPTLYQGEPRVRLISVSPPSRPERQRFFLRHLDELSLEQPRSASGRPRTAADAKTTMVDVLCDLTDQLQLADLKQILTLSKRTGKLDAQRLLNLYRFGEQRSPWEELSEERVRKVQETLRERVIGQEDAVQHVATMIVRAYMGLAGLQHSARRSKPKGTLFFVGPTGVGKTELAKACGEFLFGDEASCIRFDMSEYNHEHSDQRLVGAPPGYVGFEDGGQLTNAVRARPFSVLLFDEIEKAHGRVLDKFLQILEDGRLTDGRGETAHFSECVLIFTSNIGAASMPADATPEARREHFLREVEQHFVQKLGRPELLNRFGDNIVVFGPITDQSVRRGILERKLKPLRSYLEEKWGVKLKLSSEVENYYLNSARAAHGGRGLLNALERDLLNPLSHFLFEHKHQLQRGRMVEVSLVEGRPEFELIESDGAHG
jgi:hypothetical protein